jgi:hypothetical protein
MTESTETRISYGNLHDRFGFDSTLDDVYLKTF